MESMDLSEIEFREEDIEVGMWFKTNGWRGSDLAEPFQVVMDDGFGWLEIRDCLGTRFNVAMREVLVKCIPVAMGEVHKGEQ